MPAPAPLSTDNDADAEPESVDLAHPMGADAPASTPNPSAPHDESASATAARKGGAAPDDHPLVLRIPVGTTLAEAERLLIIKTLEVAEGNKQRAARILGISRRGLYTKLASYGEHVPAEETATPRPADPPAPSA
jgi:DNA-binding NtrC family response regulator